MSVYGNKAITIAEETDLNPSSFSEGYLAIFEAMKDPASINVVKNNDKYYVTSESVMDYMSVSTITEVEEALYNIAKANDIDYNLLETVGMFDDDYMSQKLDESVLLEKAAEDNAMTLKQAEKYYNTVISTCKSKADSKETIDECIKLLEQCVKDMERAKQKAQSDLLDGGRLKYALKGIIPFNGIYRLFKRNDWEAGLNNLAKTGLKATGSIFVMNSFKNVAKDMAQANVFNPGSVEKAIDSTAKYSKKALGVSVANTAIGIASFGVRLATYTKMLDRMIKNTKEAIDFLKNKRKELDKK